ncbi:hypothetical protein PR048_005454 [Dryococelus australis]|uniref:YqaJ viral recombinase domain-containing protein n=1 Tax=Dryococelus australis TaxID=614101 RepID=A0ABQ9I889_9NEOP|nr:hypothetical protein PR048_005454 [Dryococelus australis]
MKSVRNYARILYYIHSHFCGKRNIRKGLQLVGDRVHRTGLWVDVKPPFIGVTSDGLLGEDGLVEIKCPYSARVFDTRAASEGKEGYFVYCTQRTDEPAVGTQLHVPDTNTTSCDGQ